MKGPKLEGAIAAISRLAVPLAIAVVSVVLCGCQQPRNDASGIQVLAAGAPITCDGNINGMPGVATIGIEQMMHYKLVSIDIKTSNSAYHVDLEMGEGETAKTGKMTDSNYPNQPIVSKVEFSQNGFVLTANCFDPNGGTQYTFVRRN